MAITFGVFGVKRNNNLKAWEKALAGLPARTLPVSVAYALNGVAFKARDLLRDEAKRVFDRPTDFAVKNAFFYEFARLSATSVGQLRSRVYIKDRQSAFYKYQVDGGARFPGDIGPGAEWLFVPVAKELINPRTGGLRNNVLKGLTRRTGIVKRTVQRAQTKRDSQKKGVFFGTLFGTTAIWERPDRTTALAPRRKGVRQVRNQGAPRLLVAMFKREQYRPLFHFREIAAMAQVGFMRMQLLMCAAGMDMTYEQLTGDWRGINDRQYRASMLEYVRGLKIWQGWVIQQIMKPIWRRFVTTAFTSGIWIPPENSDPLDWYQCEITPPARGYINPLQEVETFEKAVRAGFLSRTRVAESLGVDVTMIDIENAKDMLRAGSQTLSYTTHQNPMVAGYDPRIVEQIRQEVSRDLLRQLERMRADSSDATGFAGDQDA